MSALSSGRGISARIGCIAVETPLPAAQVLAALAQEGTEERNFEQRPIEEVRRKAQRLGEIDEEHDTHVLRFVPRLVLIGVVEDEDAALLPVVLFLPDAD